MHLRALIIGSAGFVGKYLIRHLRDDLHWDVIATKLESEKIEESHIDVYNLDILRETEISEVLNKTKPDCVFHLAAQSSVYLSWKNPDLTIDINVKGCIHVLDAIRKLEYKPRTLLIGSGEEYGYIRPDEIPIVESTALRPGNIYAASKAVQNMIGKIYADAYGLDIMVSRSFNHIGPGQAPDFVVSDFCRQVAEIEAGNSPAVIRVGNLKAKRDFTDVRDVVKAYAALIQKGKTGEIYNVGSGKAVSIEELLEKILSMSKKKIKIEVDERKLRPLDIPIIEADICKLQKDTGWMQEYSLDRTISDTLEYWRNMVKE